MSYIVQLLYMAIPQENQAQVVRIQKTFAGRENIVAPGRVRQSHDSLSHEM